MNSLISEANKSLTIEELEGKTMEEMVEYVRKFKEKKKEAERKLNQL